MKIERGKKEPIMATIIVFDRLCEQRERETEKGLREEGGGPRPCEKSNDG